MSDGNYELPTAGRDPGDRAPAPGSLRLVQALVNTLNREFERDLLATPAAAAGWLATAGLWTAGPVSDAQQGVLAELREACRGVLWAHTERRPDPAAAARLATALGSCRLTLATGPDGDLRLDCADHDPFTRAVGAVATAIAEASVAGTWDRLKSCPGHLCGWAFLRPLPGRPLPLVLHAGLRVPREDAGLPRPPATLTGDRFRGGRSPIRSLPEAAETHPPGAGVESMERFVEEQLTAWEVPGCAVAGGGSGRRDQLQRRRHGRWLLVQLAGGQLDGAAVMSPATAKRQLTPTCWWPRVWRCPVSTSTPTGSAG